MQLKAFEAGRYNDESIVVRNPANGMQALFTEEEFEIVKFLKQNEEETLLALLLPNIGIAKKQHIVLCLSVIGKLKRLQIVDYVGITGRRPISNTATIEMDPPRRKLGFGENSSFATALLTVGGKMTGGVGAFPLLFLTLVAAALTFAFFPFEAVDPALHDVHGFRYRALFPAFYVMATLALNFRAILQAGYLRAVRGAAPEARLRFIPPFLTADLDRREINLAGRGARIQLGLLGILAPLALAVIPTALHLVNVLPVDAAFYAFSAAVATTLILACPFLPFDGADILHVVTSPEELGEGLSARLRRLFRSRGPLGRDLTLGLLVSLVWLFAWLDSLHSFGTSVYRPVAEDLYFYEDLPRCLAAGFTALCFLALVLMPVLVLGYSFVKDLLGARRNRVVVATDQVKDTLSHEERLAALERIPLFALLKDDERLALLAEMEPAYFADGAVLVKQGEVGKDFYVLARGEARAYFTDVKGSRYFLAELSTGDAFGEIALIDDVPRTASIISDGGCIVLRLGQEGFARFANSLGTPDRVKTMIRLTSFFRRHPLFSRLSARDQAELIDRLSFETITAGEEIPGGDENVRLLYSGVVRVDTGDDRTETKLGTDDCFGYAHGLNVKYFAAEGTGLLSLKKDDFNALVWEKLVEHPELFF